MSLFPQGTARRVLGPTGVPFRRSACRLFTPTEPCSVTPYEVRLLPKRLLLKAVSQVVPLVCRLGDEFNAEQGDEISADFVQLQAVVRRSARDNNLAGDF